jgi:hypothetical protein
MDLGAVSERETCHLKETSRTFTSAQAGGEARGRDIAVTAGTAAEGRWQVVQWQSLLMSVQRPLPRPHRGNPSK